MCHISCLRTLLSPFCGWVMYVRSSGPNRAAPMSLINKGNEPWTDRRDEVKTPQEIPQRCNGTGRGLPAHAVIMRHNQTSRLEKAQLLYNIAVCACRVKQIATGNCVCLHNIRNHKHAFRAVASKVQGHPLLHDHRARIQRQTL